MLRVYGSRISYYTGKLETYLRFRGIDYELLPTYAHLRRIREGAGTIQMPAVELPDGRWLTDSTPILAWLERDQPAPSIYPEDPALRFVALLLEDYADEWLWRPAMHYRWSYRLDRDYASGLLADEQSGGRRIPRFLRKRAVARRQLQGFVKGDGVSDETWDHVEQGYYAALDWLERILQSRRFVLGDRPSIADFGLMGPMLRHFGQDPTPQEIMRTRAPGVYAWMTRMWNARPAPDAALVDQVDAEVAGLLREACETHLVQLRENAAAVKAGKVRYEQVVQGVRYRDVPSSRYRVWCLEELRREWSALAESAQAALRTHLPEESAGVLWDGSDIGASGVDPERKAPLVKGTNVFGTGVPPR